MCDVKPVNKAGEIDVEKIKEIGKEQQVLPNFESSNIGMELFENSGVEGSELSCSPSSCQINHVESKIERRDVSELTSVNPPDLAQQSQDQATISYPEKLNPKLELVHKKAGNERGSITEFKHSTKTERGDLKNQERYHKIEKIWGKRVERVAENSQGVFGERRLFSNDNGLGDKERRDNNKKEQLFFSNYKKNNSDDRNWRGLVFRPFSSFATVSLVSAILFFGAVVISYGLQMKDNVKVKGEKVTNYFEQAKSDMKSRDFASAGKNIGNIKNEFQEIQEELNKMGGKAAESFSSVPYLSKISSGKVLVDVGAKLAAAAEETTKVIEILSSIENPFTKGTENESLTEMFLRVNEHTTVIHELLVETNNDLERVNIEDLPVEYQDKLRMIKKNLPLAISGVEVFNSNSKVFLELLGHNGPRKYMFLFQNNHEMRATGGFIGSYGIMKIKDGQVENLHIDGIYNPDGQLTVDVIPPTPIRKISAGWSTHDANWFPNFPTSAEKIAWFYEKTGGPTVDGIITLTPNVLQKILAITGPIEMKEYDVTVDKDNFVEEVQNEVEVDFDLEVNQPKRIISDLTPEILNQLLGAKDLKKVAGVFAVLEESLREKHMLFYSFDGDIQNLISENGWSGEVLQTEKDYLMVINSNINGYKTDGVVDEEIFHEAEIMPNGAVVNTVKIRRTHNGGDTDYEWWNKVNSNYMRVYVPLGSKLLSVSGQTRDIVKDPLDYKALGFKTDPDVERQEKEMTIDEDSGTHIYEEDNKTVFGNWVYVSPKEVVEIEYKYMLPFEMDFNKNEERADSYSLLIQKQPGSAGSKFESEIKTYSGVEVVWKNPEKVEIKKNRMNYKTTLSQDKFFGAVMQKR